MNIDKFNDCLELSALRETKFYTHLHPYIHGFVQKNGVKNQRFSEEEEKYLTVEERYFVKLDILFGQIFQNIKNRQFWKRQLAELEQAQNISLIGFSCLYRAYINELVVLFERLGRFLPLFEKAFGEKVDTEDLKNKILRFFDPFLFLKRNYDQHRMYLGFPRHAELAEIEEKALKDHSYVCIYDKKIREEIGNQINWINYTEEKISNFLKLYLDSIEEKIKNENGYMIPIYLLPNFSFEEKLDHKIRQEHKHKELWESEELWELARVQSDDL